MRISPARLAAFDVLSRIETDGAFSSVLLPIAEKDLQGSDRGLCHELVMGVLRRQMLLDRVIGQLSGNRKLDTAVSIALRLGAYQIVFLDKIPTYSAINESVNLVQRAKKTSAKGLVNAVLRKLSKGVPQPEYSDTLEKLSIETSHPRWLLERWQADLGEDAAAEIATANNTLPQSAFRVTLKGNSSSDSLLTDRRRSEFVDGCYFADSLDQGLRDAADAADIYFQDEASQMVAQVVSGLSGTRVLDVCAAPGGKTSQIAGKLAGRPGRFIVAGDLRTARVRLLSSTCERQCGNLVNVLQYDAAGHLPFAEETFDTVLVDAPCSGTGTIRHNPEIRYFLEESDFADLADKQLAILRNASKLVRSGGNLVYSTCSLQNAENEAVCRTFQMHAPEFRVIEPGIAAHFLTDEGFARTFPHRDNMDGFFIATFERN